MVASVLAQAGIEAVHNRAGANMPRRCRDRARAARARRGRHRGLAARASSRSTRPGSAAWCPSSSRTPWCSATCSATSSTATASWRCWPTTGPGSSPSGAAGRTSFVLNADDPLVADLGRDGDGRQRGSASSYFGVEDRSHALPALEHAFDAKHCRRCGAAVQLRGRLPRAPRRLRLPELRQPRARARRWPPRASSCTGMSRLAASSIADARRRARAVPPPPRPLQRLQRARRDRLLPRARASRPRPDRSAGSSPSARGVRARRDASSRRPRAVDPADQEPRRGERGLPHADAAAGGGEPASSTSGSRSTTASPTGATSPGSGTPTSSCSRASRDRVICSGTRAEELALRLKYAGVDDARLESRPSLEDGLDARPGAGTAAGRCTRSRPTPRCSSCATCSPPAATRSRSGNERLLRTTEPAIAPIVWHDLECGSYRAGPRALAGACRRAAPRRRRARCSTSAAAPAASASTLAAHGHRVTGLDLDRRACRPSSAGVRRPRTSPRARSSATRGHFDLGRRFDLVLAADAAAAAAPHRERARSRR